MEKQGLDITTQYHFDSEKECDSFYDRYVSFESFTFNIILFDKYKSGKLYRKRTEEFAVEYRQDLKIYKEENNNCIYLVSCSEFRPHNETGPHSCYCQPKYYTVKDFIEISPNNFIVDLENFITLYLPNKEKAENSSYEKMNSETFLNHIKQIQEQDAELFAKFLDEQKEKRQIRNKYFECVNYLKELNDDNEKRFLKKMSGFDYTSKVEETYSLEQIESIRNKFNSCCSLKQYNFIKGLASQWGLVIKPDVFIFKKTASKIIQILKSGSDIYQDDTINVFFERI